LYNEIKAEARRPTYEFYYDYRKVKIAVPVCSQAPDFETDHDAVQVGLKKK